MRTTCDESYCDSTDVVKVLVDGKIDLHLCERHARINWIMRYERYCYWMREYGRTPSPPRFVVIRNGPSPEDMGWSL